MARRNKVRWGIVVEQLTVLYQNLKRRYGEFHWWNDENPIKDLVSMILIQQTTEANAKRALEQLEGRLTIHSLLEMPVEDLQECIRPAGFFKQKSLYIRSVVEWANQFDGDFSRLDRVETAVLRKELLSLKGVGNETADVILLYLCRRSIFVADQYALRLFNRLGLSQSQDYLSLRQEFTEQIKDWSVKDAQELHALIDEHGKQFRLTKGELDESWLMI
nr:endonuclease III domain-containing protein [Streptococcus suis]